MTRGLALWLFGALTALLLGSATPPSWERIEAPRLDYAELGCAGACEAVLPGTPPPAVAKRLPVSDVRIVVSLPQQKAWVFKGRELYAVAPVSTGRRGHETPVGRYRILEKAVVHHSNRYSNAPMPYMQRLTTYGIALHAGYLPGYPASHGCIRLPRSIARELYRITNYGTRVVVTRARPKSPREALAIA